MVFRNQAFDVLEDEGERKTHGRRRDDEVRKDPHSIPRERGCYQTGHPDPPSQQDEASASPPFPSRCSWVQLAHTNSVASDNQKTRPNPSQRPPSSSVSGLLWRKPLH
ncbi:hypothetical protein BLNAU_983 [Blattamonas nauphoetae]|uniref:Uncharacterized protein n=1 Tax=Blattamonas nauphoetae TaxID=2049346 RepID=A0ABQ9YJT4_9EUKA|nr:hypothetical protein BLNAU_983 [Blattamonas nauphoetae]